MGDGVNKNDGERHPIGRAGHHFEEVFLDGELLERRLVDMPAVDDLPIRPSEFYEDCRYHPMLCVETDYDDDDEIRGISLILGGGPGACSWNHCGVRKLSFEEAVAIARTGINWSACYYCGHSQVHHHDLTRGGCDYPGEDCACNHPWTPASRVEW